MSGPESRAPADQGGASTRWGIFLLAYCAGVMGALQIGKMPSALPEIRAELGLGLVEAGWVISMFNLIGASCGIAMGAFTDWLGHRRITVAALLCVGAASLAGAFAESGAAILASRLVEGVGAIVVFIAAPVIIIRAVRPRDLRLALGIWGSYMPAGMAFMVLLTPWFLDRVGWRGLWMANGAALVAFAILMWWGTRSLAPRAAAGGDRAAPLRSLWRDISLTVQARGPLLLALCFSTYTANFLAVLGFLPTFLIEQRGMEGGVAALLTALAIAVNVFGNLLGAALLHRGARRWVLIAISSAIMGVASLGFYSASVPDEARYLLCLVFSGLGGMLPASVMGGAPVHAPGAAQLGTTTGLIQQGSNLGQVLGPPALAALVAAGGGWQAAPWLVAVLAAIGVVLAFRIGRLERALSIPQ